jgi:predicted NBD/HSP70 family sugar kinase
MERLAGSAKLLRAMNTSAVLAHLIGRGPLTRSDIRELTGLSKPTTSEVLRKLVAAELAMVTGYVSGGPGPNAEIYTANPDSAYAAAMSIRETTGDPVVALAVGDLAGVTRARGEVTVDLATADPAAVLAGALRALCRDAGLDATHIRHTQLGVPGSYDHTTDTIHHVDVPGLARPGLVSALRAALGGAVAVDNDVNLAAVAERRRGAAADAETFALLWLDDGLGLAIDLGGTLLRGARGGAGEIGYMPLGMPAKGDVPGTGDLHTVLAGPEVVALARAHGAEAATPAEAVAAGGPEFLAELALRVGVAVATVVAVLDPALVVLSGAVGRAGGDRLRDAVEAALGAIGPLAADVASTALTDDAVLLGALDAGLEAVREDLIRSVHDANAPVVPSPR